MEAGGSGTAQLCYFWLAFKEIEVGKGKLSSEMTSIDDLKWLARHS
jgi:hypothetical protein